MYRGERQNGRNFSRCLSRWCQGHLPVWVPVHSPYFLCMQNRKGRLDYMDQMCFTVSECSNSYLFNLEFKIPIFFPSVPRRTHRSWHSMLAQDSGAWFHLLFPSAWPWGKPLKHFMVISLIRILPLYLCMSVNSIKTIGGKNTLRKVARAIYIYAVLTICYSYYHYNQYYSSQLLHR